MNDTIEGPPSVREFNDKLDRVQTNIADALAGLRLAANSALGVREAVLDFERGIITLPELVRKAKEDWASL